MHAECDENREFFRLDHETALNFREVKSDKLANKQEILVRNISACGLLFRTESIPPTLSSSIWIELDPKMMGLCKEIEEDLLILNNGILGRVVRISEGEPGISYDVGIGFLRKKDMTPEEIEDLLSG
ncbi:MAG: hypothetical protein KKB12_01690 [Candidatus Omnitrophica bacterium]|nr:hypothetical protein [Candidatus Omnitrophota bacterium]MBU1656861.1 hypothetical protein [Candidatus Omnitrophota bacterium]